MKTKFLTLALAALTIGLLGSCCKKEEPKMSVTGVTLDKNSLEITVGDSDVKLIATIAPENATDKTVSWSSDKTEFATVDNQGNVHAVAPGIANITVTTTDGNKTATCAVTVKAALPEGALSGIFSVSATKKVHFSKGNLYWDGDSFELETNQYDVQSSWSTSHVSHFFWSKDASVAYAASYSESGTAVTDVFFTNATAETAKSDFTVNGVTGKYRTLSTNEWQYLFNTRTMKNGKDRYTPNITYGGKMGLVLYPDDYDNDPIHGSVETMPEGVVFLPAAGDRIGSYVYDVGGVGIYWSSSAYDEGSAYYVFLDSGSVIPDYSDGRCNGFSVRLVTEVK